MLCHSLLPFASASCRWIVGVVFSLLQFYAVSNELFIQSAHDYTFCTLIRPISVLLLFFALFMITCKQHNTGLIAHLQWSLSSTGTKLVIWLLMILLEWDWSAYKDSNSWMHENVHCWEKNSGLAYVATKAIRWHSTVATAYSWRFIMQLISKFSH